MRHQKKPFVPAGTKSIQKKHTESIDVISCPYAVILHLPFPSERLRNLVASFLFLRFGVGYPASRSPSPHLQNTHVKYSIIEKYNQYIQAFSSFIIIFCYQIAMAIYK
jgi:hypothetical protein